MDFSQQANAKPKQPSIHAKLTDVSKDVAWLEHEKRELQSKIDNQAATILELQNERDLRLQLSKLALYIGSDGSLTVSPTMPFYWPEWQLIRETARYYVYEQIG